MKMHDAVPVARPSPRARAAAAAARQAAPAAATISGIINMPACVVPMFVYLHIPKTAGITMRHVFARMFGKYYHNFLTDAASRAAMGEVPPYERPGFFDDKLMLAGHIIRFHPIVRAIKGRRCVFVSTLRDPARRAESFYDHLQLLPKHPLHADVAGRSLLAAFSRPGRYRSGCENRQLHVLFGTKHPPDLAKPLASNNFILGQSDELERFAKAVAAFSGMPAPNRIPRLNTRLNHPATDIRPAREQPDYAEAMAAIRAANAAEYGFLERFTDGLLVNLPSWEM